MKKLLAVIGIMGMLGLALAPFATALAQAPQPAEQCNVSTGPGSVAQKYPDTCGGCGGSWSEGSTAPTCQPVCCVLTLVENIGTWFFWVVLVIAFIMLLWGAVQFMTAGGSEDKTAAARQTLVYALIGVAIAFFSRLLINLVTGMIAGG